MTEGGGPVGTGATTPLHSTTRRPWDGVRQHRGGRTGRGRGPGPARPRRGAGLRAITSLHAEPPTPGAVPDFVGTRVLTLFGPAVVLLAGGADILDVLHGPLRERFQGASQRLAERRRQRVLHADRRLRVHRSQDHGLRSCGSCPYSAMSMAPAESGLAALSAARHRATWPLERSGRQRSPGALTWG